MYSNNQELDKAMTPEQFAQVVDAILAGKYSWACVLILRFAGYNPLHYIPYRTYNRLMKENNPFYQKRKDKKQERKSKHKISDLAYLESLDHHQAQVKGGKSDKHLFSTWDSWAKIIFK